MYIRFTDSTGYPIDYGPYSNMADAHIVYSGIVDIARKLWQKDGQTRTVTWVHAETKYEGR